MNFTVLEYFLNPKPFDTVNHDILLNKLVHYGFRGTAMQWSKNYLTNIKKSTECRVRQLMSNRSTITCGVPQGSVLGPLLFLLYVKDIPMNSQSLCHFHCLQMTHIYSIHWIKS